MATKLNSTTAIITQQAIQEYHELTEYVKGLTGRLAQERERLFHLLDTGAAVEPGPWQVSIKPCKQQRLTKAILIAVLGEDEYERLREEAPPTVYRYLRVEKRTGRRSSFPERPGNDRR
jgi:hypothetical protein